jgi:DNA-binding transcriptional LysR family regulator
MRLTQPAVAEQVRRLEAELGTTLVRREGRGVKLTTDGRVFLDHAERVLAASEEARASVGRGNSAGRVLTLGMTRNAPHYPVEDLVAMVSATMPGVRLRLPGGNSSTVARAVREGELDAAVVILPVEPRGLMVRALFADEVLLVTTDRERASRPVKLSSLATHPLILYDAASGFADPTRRQLVSRAQGAGIDLASPLEVEHVETAVRLAARGLGDTIAPSAATQQPWFPPELFTAPFAEPIFDHFAVITRTGPEPVGAMRELVNIVTSWGDAVQLPRRRNEPPRGESDGNDPPI